MAGERLDGRFGRAFAATGHQRLRNKGFSQQHRDEGSQAKPKTKSELVLVCKEAAENVTRNLQGIFYKTHS